MHDSGQAVCRGPSRLLIARIGAAYRAAAKGQDAYSASACCPSLRCRALSYPACLPPHRQESFMGKYVLGWFLGVPLIVLVVIYFFAH